MQSIHNLIVTSRPAFSRVLTSSKPVQGWRLYSYSRPDPGERYMSPMEKVLSRRAKLISSQPVETFRVAGVSFEGRQVAVSQLEQSK